MGREGGNGDCVEVGEDRFGTWKLGLSWWEGGRLGVKGEFLTGETLDLLGVVRILSRCIISSFCAFLLSERVD